MNSSDTPKSAKMSTKITAENLLIALLSCIMVFTTLYLPKKITTTNTLDTLNNITCGWPIPFVKFDSHSNPPPELTISCIGWSGSPMDTKKEILWIPLFTNVALAFSVIWTGTYLLKKLHKHN